MAFDSINMTLVYGGGKSHIKRYSYLTTDDLATVMASGYFANHSPQLSTGDIVDVTIGDAINATLRSTGVPITLYISAK